MWEHIVFGILIVVVIGLIYLISRLFKTLENREETLNNLDKRYQRLLFQKTIVHIYSQKDINEFLSQEMFNKQVRREILYINNVRKALKIKNYPQVTRRNNESR